MEKVTKYPFVDDDDDDINNNNNNFVPTSQISPMVSFLATCVHSELNALIFACCLDSLDAL